MNDRVRVGETGQQTPIPRLSRPSPAPELAESPDLDESGRCAGGEGWEEDIDDGTNRMAVTPRTVTARTVTVRQRVLAILALGAYLLLLVAVLVFLLNNAVELVMALVGLAVAVGGGWWMVTEEVPRRGFGIAGLIAGFVIIVLAILRAATTTDQGLPRIAVLAALLAVAGAAARAALVPDLHALDAQLAGERWRPKHPVLICNPWSGGGKVEEFGLLGRAQELGVETVLLDHGLDLEQLARDAIAGGADCLGMAGGDGSQALVASISIEHDIPFVCVAAGTRNHFALDLGLDREDPRGSMDAFHDAVERRIDYATVGDRLFVNNVSLGVYATIVQQDSYRDAKRETSRTLLPEMLGITAEPFDLQFTTPDGIEINGAFLIMVSNSPYVLGPSVDVSQRRSMETGTLGVFAVNAASGSEAARLMAASAVGLRGRDPGWHEFTCESFEVRSRAGSAFAGVDGEALDMPTPMRFLIHPRGMRVLVPKWNLEVTARRRARNVTAGALLAVARGKSSSANVTVEVSGRSGFIESLASRTRRPATSSPSQSPGPLLDLIPVPEVTFGQNRASSRQLPHRPLCETQASRIKDAEEYAVASRMDGLLELGELPWLGGRAQINSLGVSGFGAKRTIAEQPHRLLRQEVLVAPDERYPVLQPAPQVGGATDDEPLVAAEIARLLHRSCIGVLSTGPETLPDPLRNLSGGTMFAGIRNKNRHPHRLQFHRGSSAPLHHRAKGPPGARPASDLLK